MHVVGGEVVAPGEQTAGHEEHRHRDGPQSDEDGVDGAAPDSDNRRLGRGGSLIDFDFMDREHLLPPSKSAPG